MAKVVIAINGTKYEVDMARATELGALKPLPVFPLTAGDVYVHPYGNINPLLLVNCAYGLDSWQLCGLGVAPNSNQFYRQTHTKAEIEAHLIEEGLQFKTNINQQIGRLVTGRE